MASAPERALVDPVTLQVAANAFATIADEMATTIFRTAHSTVVRDGMDFSAALLSPVGETVVAQAVSVPFHLGSIPVAMERLLARFGDDMQPGDVFLMNDPFDGGIHLQDLFVFKPVHAGGELIGFTATTAHHGDVGGAGCRGRARVTTRRSSRRGSACRGFASTRRASRSTTSSASSRRTSASRA